MPQLLPRIALIGLTLLMLPAPPAAGQTSIVTTPDAPAQDEARNVNQSPPDYFAKAQEARLLADTARQNSDVATMLLAVRLLREIPLEAAGSTPHDPMPDEATFTPRGLLAEARAMAKGDATLLTQIRVMENEASRGVVASAFGRGLVRSIQAINPRAAYQFNVTARGGEPLRLGVIGDIGTALTMRLTDARGKVVCLDDQNDYAPVCQLTPGAPTQFRVDILNKSALRSRAVILSN